MGRERENSQNNSAALSRISAILRCRRVNSWNCLRRRSRLRKVCVYQDWSWKFIDRETVWRQYLWKICYWNIIGYWRLHFKQIHQVKVELNRNVKHSPCFFHIFTVNGFVEWKKAVYLHPLSANGTIAQLVEQRTENPCVPGSIPGGTTAKKTVTWKCDCLFLWP